MIALLVIVGTVTTIVVAVIAAVEVRRMDNGQGSLLDKDKFTGEYR